MVLHAKAVCFITLQEISIKRRQTVKATVSCVGLDENVHKLQNQYLE